MFKCIFIDQLYTSTFFTCYCESQQLHSVFIESDLVFIITFLIQILI